MISDIVAATPDPRFIPTLKGEAGRAAHTAVSAQSVLEMFDQEPDALCEMIGHASLAELSAVLPAADMVVDAAREKAMMERRSRLLPRWSADIQAALALAVRDLIELEGRRKAAAMTGDKLTHDDGDQDRQLRLACLRRDLLRDYVVDQALSLQSPERLDALTARLRAFETRSLQELHGALCGALMAAHDRGCPDPYDFNGAGQSNFEMLLLVHRLLRQLAGRSPATDAQNAVNLHAARHAAGLRRRVLLEGKRLIVMERMLQETRPAAGADATMCEQWDTLAHTGRDLAAIHDSLLALRASLAERLRVPSYDEQNAGQDASTVVLVAPEVDAAIEAAQEAARAVEEQVASWVTQAVMMQMMLPRASTPPELQPIWGSIVLSCGQLGGSTVTDFSTDNKPYRRLENALAGYFLFRPGSEESRTRGASLQLLTPGATQRTFVRVNDWLATP